MRDSLTEACTWRASGGGLQESWRGGRPWRTKVAAPSAPFPKPWKWTLQSGLDWIELCQRLECKTSRAEKDQKETRVVLPTQRPVLVVVTERSAPSVGHCWELTVCMCACPGETGQGKWLAVLEGRDLEVRQTQWRLPTQQSGLYLFKPLCSNMTETEWGGGVAPSWLTLQSHAPVWTDLTLNAL